MLPLYKLMVERLLGSPAAARGLRWERKEEERTEEDNEEERRGCGVRACVHAHACMEGHRVVACACVGMRGSGAGGLSRKAGEREHA